jgi:hypothetical protein
MEAFYMAKLGTKRSINDCARIGLMTVSGVESQNMGYCNDLYYYQGDESIYKAERIAACMPKEQGEQLINFIKKSNEKMEADSHGGFREGAGRPKTGAMPSKTIRMTDEEYIKVKEYLKDLRASQN